MSDESRAPHERESHERDGIAGARAPDRRALLKAGTLLLGASLIPTRWSDVAAVAPGALREESSPHAREVAPAGLARMVTPEDEAALALIADAMFPATPGSPSAIDAGVGPVVTRLVNDCWSAQDRERLLAGLDRFLARCQLTHGRPFRSLAAEQRMARLAEEDAAATAAQPAHWFHHAYRVIAQAYWSSEAGATRALRWIAVPGRWVGCTTLERGQPAWA